ncbi:MAG: DNA gyrase subunit A [Rhodospirillales bacterium]|nr:DNA gyrase subunit A [Rhodospirillales bacterium]
MRKSYLDYAMSVIVARALPDVRDGLKPVHRRILYAMEEEGYASDKPYRKSARIIGDVMGKYHPHGDSAIYDAMVRMAQDFSMRVPLIDGQGNFGSMDNDPPAAMRYTEARLARVAESLLDDIDNDTVDFRDNYDGSEQEPVVLPARFPNLLVNGGSGIAVGMATNIPPHNLGEVIDACCACIANPGVSSRDLMRYVLAPDFPTGGIVMGRQGIVQAFETGRGSITLRARTHIEEIRKDREAIVVTEIPYQVNKARMIERISELVREKRIEGIGELRDESDRHGVRVVIELRRDAMADVVLNQLYRFTPLQNAFAVNMLALDDTGRPQLMTLRDIIGSFVAFREQVVTRRTRHLLGKTRDRAHLLLGLALAVANVDEVVALIRNAADPQEARAGLMARTWPLGDILPLIALVEGEEIAARVEADGFCMLSEEQARAILDLRLHRLTGLERDRIAAELGELGAHIADYLDILRSRERLMSVIRAELSELRERFADERRTEISDAAADQDDEDLIRPEDMVVTVSHKGYVKRVPLATYRAQKRGGKGRSGMATRDEDFVSRVFVVNTHAWLLFFSTSGLVYRLKTYRLPMATPQARGKAFVNLLPLDEGETISTVLPMPLDEESWDRLHIMFATAHGSVRRNRLSDFANIRANGLIAMKLGHGERLIGVETCRDDRDVLLFTRQGRCIRFRVGDIRLFAGRTSSGVRGIRLAGGDEVLGMTILDHVEVDAATRRAFFRRVSQERRADDMDEADDASEDASEDVALADAVYDDLKSREQFLLTMASDGFGKRSSAYDYRVTGRGGKGIGNMNLDRGGETPRAEVVAAFPVGQSDQVVLVSDGGQLIRSAVDEIRITGRCSRGVTVFRVAGDERVVSVARIDDEADDEDNEEAPDEDIDENSTSPQGALETGTPSGPPTPQDETPQDRTPQDRTPQDETPGEETRK